MTERTMGDRIREAREAKGTKASALADAVGCRPTTIWRYEARGMQPSPQVLARIAEELGVSMEWLTTGKGDGPATLEATGS